MNPSIEHHVYNAPIIFLRVGGIKFLSLSRRYKFVGRLLIPNRVPSRRSPIYNVYILYEHSRHLSPGYNAESGDRAAYMPLRPIPRGLAGLLRSRLLQRSSTISGFPGSRVALAWMVGGRRLIARPWEQPVLCTLCKPSRWKISRAQSAPGNSTQKEQNSLKPTHVQCPHLLLPIYYLDSL